MEKNPIRKHIWAIGKWHRDAYQGLIAGEWPDSPEGERDAKLQAASLNAAPRSRQHRISYCANRYPIWR